MKAHVLLGPPGSGKGTMAKHLASIFPLDHISTGDMLRDAVSKETAIGLRAKAAMTDGRFVDDSTVNDLVFARLRDEKMDVLLDGYPRTLNQARAFADFLSASNVELGCVIDIDVPNDVLEARVVKRRICSNSECGAIYHLDRKLSRVENVCDVCGSPLKQRHDDTPEAFQKRMEEVYTTFRPLQEYFQGTLNYRKVNGVGAFDDVFASAVKIFEEYA